MLSGQSNSIYYLLGTNPPEIGDLALVYSSEHRECMIKTVTSVSEVRKFPDYARFVFVDYAAEEIVLFNDVFTCIDDREVAWNTYFHCEPVPEILKDLLLTQDQFNAIFATKSYGCLRHGQALMVSLSEVNKHLYKKVTNTEYDPFFDDNLIEKFTNYIGQYIA